MSNNQLKFIKRLNGHSGCQLNLLKIDEKFVVRKQATNKNYNYRLRKQCAKQLKFSSLDVLAPKIYNYSYSDDLFYFDMEFIQGKTLAEYSETILITEIMDFIRLLFKTLYYDNAEYIPQTNIIFNKKITELELKLANNKTCILEKAFKVLKAFDWNYVCKSPCHGDLTLENIIISSNKIYLIDFLDSFFNSWMMDIAKILQDIELGWAFRNCKENANRNLRLLVAKEVLFEEISKMENSENIITTIYHILLLNLIRIYPYTSDKKTFIFLDNAIEKVMNKLNK